MPFKTLTCTTGILFCYYKCCLLFLLRSTQTEIRPYHLNLSIYRQKAHTIAFRTDFLLQRGEKYQYQEILLIIKYKIIHFVKGGE